MSEIAFDQLCASAEVSLPSALAIRDGQSCILRESRGGLQGRSRASDRIGDEPPGIRAGPESQVPEGSHEHMPPTELIAGERQSDRTGQARASDARTDVSVLRRGSSQSAGNTNNTGQNRGPNRHQAHLCRRDQARAPSAQDHTLLMDPPGAERRFWSSCCSSRSYTCPLSSLTSPPIRKRAMWARIRAPSSPASARGRRQSLLAAIGIVCLDEFDKIASGQNMPCSPVRNHQGRHRPGRAARAAQMLESSEVVVPLEMTHSTFKRPRVDVDRRCGVHRAGAFSGFHPAGAPPRRRRFHRVWPHPAGQWLARRGGRQLHTR